MDRRTFVARSAKAGAALSILGCSRNVIAGSGSIGFSVVRDRYFVRVLELNPVTSTYLGGDGYSPTLAGANGRLRDFRPDALAQELRFYREIQRQLKSMDPATLSAPDRIDRDVLDAQVNFILHQVGDLRYYQRSVDTYVAEPFRGIDWQIQQMTDAGNGLLGTEQEWQLVVSRLRAITPYLSVASANLTDGKRDNNYPDWRMIQRDGIAGSRANADYFSKTLPALARQYIGSRSFATSILASLDPASQSAAAAYTQFASFLETTFGNSRQDRFAIGEREYEWRVHNNLRDPRTAQQLWEYGAEQVAHYQTLMSKVPRESSPTPRNDDELLAWYIETGKRAVQYGRDNNLFAIPADYRLDVVPTPPVLRSTIDAAYYPAPPFKKSGVGRFYLSPTGNDAAALAENTKASVADTAVHEGFPGHDWHYKYMTEHGTGISNIRWLTPGAVEDSSSMWEDSMAAEGWALYSEELMSEAAPGHPYGFYSPAEYLYELQGQLMRAVRVRVDVGIHTGRMTFDEAVAYFKKNMEVGDDTAQRAIYRYSKWPTQAITYNLGKNAIVALREEYKQKKGSSYSAREFHERFMSMGTIPANYFRESFLK
ncbi:MAG TPA: DUF885 domain-containing protein [Longimicrobiales bacterium]|nr:DUF885 domain-containing protein [Longimicrobiales bacterium]